MFDPPQRTGGSFIGLGDLVKVVRPLGGGLGGRGIGRRSSRRKGSGGGRMAATTVLSEAGGSLTYGGTVTAADERVHHGRVLGLARCIRTWSTYRDKV